MGSGLLRLRLADEDGRRGVRVWLCESAQGETVYEILRDAMRLGIEQAASVLGKNYAGNRCFKEATLQTCYRCIDAERLVKAILRHALDRRDWRVQLGRDSSRRR